MREDYSIVILAVAASALAGGLVYATSPRQRWLNAPLPTFPGRVSAALAAMVACRAYVEILDAPVARFHWFMFAMGSAIALAWGGASLRQHRRRSVNTETFMQHSAPTVSLTRIVADCDACLELAEIQAVLTRIRSALYATPAKQRGYLAEALLLLAVEEVRNRAKAG